MASDYSNNRLLTDQGLNITSVSSANTFNDSENYGLSLNGRSSSQITNNDLKTNDADVQQTSSDVSTTSYSSNSGYGLVNAGAAVAKAIGQNTFADVPDLGGKNWGADMVKAPEAWTKGYTGKGVVVAVVDTGVDYNHEDLRDNIWTNTKEIADNGIDDDGNGYIDDVRGWNFIENTNEVLDKNGHGTHVSGTIAGENNDYGVTGIAYDSKIMSVKVLNDSGSGSYSGIANGIYYAVNNGANVINLSLGSNFPNSTLESAIEYASRKGVVVVMAAGNNGYPITSYPATYADKWGIAVGAVDRNNNMADFSNEPGISQLAYVTAPGVDIYSSVPGNKYAYYKGTSMATPHVAGVVALMLSANRNLTDAQVRQIITQTAGNSTSNLNSGFNFNNNSLVGQLVAQMPNNITQIPTSNFNLSSITERNTATLDLDSISISKLQNNDLFSEFTTLDTRHYDSTLNNK
ncbi:MAG: S8 family peptidase [Gloeotrichia echinulata DEX184]|jgi:subtilisin family serine protease|nr:S8 family serine peptidase [Gloeotrichia echinulata DEX184]